MKSLGWWGGGVHAGEELADGCNFVEPIAAGLTSDGGDILSAEVLRQGHWHSVNRIVNDRSSPEPIKYKPSERIQNLRDQNKFGRVKLNDRGVRQKLRTLHTKLNSPNPKYKN